MIKDDILVFSVVVCDVDFFKCHFVICKYSCITALETTGDHILRSSYGHFPENVNNDLTSKLTFLATYTCVCFLYNLFHGFTLTMSITQYYISQYTIIFL